MLAASDGAAHLPTTLAGIEAQTAAFDRLIAVDGGSRDTTRALLGDSIARSVLHAPREPYGRLIARGVAALPEARDGDWLWLLAHDAAPHPRALEMLLAHAEAHPSVTVVGPKVMRAEQSDRFAEFGQSMTRLGRSLLLHAGELDQGQRNDDSDRLGVAETGMLVRRDVLEQIGGFDDALPSIDAGLDVGVRARLAGHRVAVEPRARVRRDGGPEHFAARSIGDAHHVAIARRAQLHRRLAYAPLALLPLQWLLVLPLALVRTVAHLLAKRPTAVLAEWQAALAAMAALPAVVRARARIRRSRTVPWSQLRPLRASWRSVRLQRRALGDPERMHVDLDERVGYVEGAGLWVTALALAVGIVHSVQLLGAGAATGGALLPLSGSVAELWGNVLAGQRDALGDVVGAADPFALALALLGSLTPWNPSTAVVVLLFLAPALASLTGFFAIRRLTTTRWAPAIGAAVWAFSPILLLAIAEGRLGAILAHIALPLAVVGMLRAGTSWRTAGAAALAVALVVAGAPSLAPALLVTAVLGAVVAGRRAMRPLLALLPAAALLAPVVVDRVVAGHPLASLADPGVPLRSLPPTPVEAALLAADGTLGGLRKVAALLGEVDAVWLGVALVAPLAVCALAGVVLRPERAWIWVVLLLAGYATAVGASRLALTAVDDAGVAVWAGPGASLALLALVGLAALAAEADPRRAAVPGTLVALAAAAAAVPIVVIAFLAPATVVPAPERRMPAFVDAAAETEPHVGTLVLRALGEQTLAVRVERGSGTTLDALSTAELVRSEPSDRELELAQVAVDLASGGDVDASGVLDELGVRFLLLEPEREGGAAVHDRAQRSLDARGDLQSTGQTVAGLLWQRVAEPVAPEPIRAPWAGALLAAQLLALAGAAVAALPSLRRGARTRTRRTGGTGEWQ